MSVTVPLKLLHESQGLVVTIETSSGDMYRGHMKEVDDYMNVILEDVSIVAGGSKHLKCTQALVRGSNIRFFVLPPALKFAPFLTPRGTG